MVTGKDIGINEEYYKCNIKFKHSDAEALDSSDEENKDALPVETIEQEEPIPVHSYVKINNVKAKFQKTVKKLMIVKKFPAKIIDDHLVSSHLESIKSSNNSLASSSSKRKSVCKPRSIQHRLTTFAIDRTRRLLDSNTSRNSIEASSINEDAKEDDVTKEDQNSKNGLPENSIVMAGHSDSEYSGKLSFK